MKYISKLNEKIFGFFRLKTIRINTLSEAKNEIILSSSSGSVNFGSSILMRLEKLKKYEIAKELLEKYDIDIIQFNDGLFEALMSYRLSKKYGIPLCFYKSSDFLLFLEEIGWYMVISSITLYI